MRAQAATKVGRLADVERGPCPVAEYVDTRRGRRLAACAFSDAAPMLAPIFEDKGLLHELSCEIRGRSANAKHFGGKPLVVGRLARREASEQSIPDHGVVS